MASFVWRSWIESGLSGIGNKETSCNLWESTLCICPVLRVGTPAQRLLRLHFFNNRDAHFPLVFQLLKYAQLFCLTYTTLVHLLYLITYFWKHQRRSAHNSSLLMEGKGAVSFDLFSKINTTGNVMQRHSFFLIVNCPCSCFSWRFHCLEGKGQGEGCTSITSTLGLLFTVCGFHLRSSPLPMSMDHLTPPPFLTAHHSPLFIASTLPSAPSCRNIKPLPYPSLFG